MEAAAPEVFVISPGQRPSEGAEVLWAGWGSVDLAGVRSAWERRARTADLATAGGPWAVVLFDPGTGDHLIAADPVGVQPLYWTRTGTGQVAVASWLARLVEHPDVDDAIDYEGVVITGALDGPGTLERTQFAAVRKVPMGCAVRIRYDGSAVVQRYWDPQDLPEPDESLSLQDCAELLRERVDAAIRRLIPASTPLGSHVSGGLDCSSIACRANQILREAGGGLVAGYSWSPTERVQAYVPGDERWVLNEITRQEGFPIRRIEAGPQGDWWFDCDPAAYPQTSHLRERFVLPMAQADGVRVMFSGWGGDEFASSKGRGVFAMLVRSGKWDQLWNEARSRRAVRSGRWPALFDQIREFQTLVRRGQPAWWGNLVHPVEARERRRRLADLEAHLTGISPRIAHLWSAQQSAWKSVRTPRDVQLLQLRAGHLQARTAGWYQTGRLFDIEYRYPLLDLDVITTSLRLPWWAWQNGVGRAAFRRAVQPWVPASVTGQYRKVSPAAQAPGVMDSYLNLDSPRPSVRADDARYLQARAAAFRALRAQRGS